MRSFLKLPTKKITELITEYLVEQMISKSAKNNIFYTLKHACVQNDVLLNWDRIKSYTKAKRTGNEIIGYDRGYEHKEIHVLRDFIQVRENVYIVLILLNMAFIIY